MKNWENKEIDIRTQALVHDMKRQAVMRMVALKVLQQNDIDVFVSPPLAELPGKIGVPSGGTTSPFGAGHGYGAALGTPEVFVPAGFSDTVYEPTFALNADATEYEGTPGTTPTKLASPLPFNIGFWAGPGDETIILKVASAYEAATRHRKPPAGFGPLPSEQRLFSAR
jgi:Asp-tRNA(Asn)/Glu-tRNA(Gln) amidotransferase A subunit family amidase